jgi:Na+/H+ antiporter NhaD/arsenite permease-like protein
LAVILFTTEKIRIDLAALLIMIILPWSGIITPGEAFSGFSSNAVVTIIGVMILGYGIEISGSLNFIADYISTKAGGSGKKVMVWIAGGVGIISSFMQNIGAVALFLPVVKKVGKNTGTSSKKLFLPMGFAGILGGTLTMIASSPLIILNDFLEENGYQPLNFFAVTPVGIILLASGTAFFYYFWKEYYLTEELKKVTTMISRIYTIFLKRFMK